ncbi:NAD(P)-dependent oxidoreductase [Photobacterium sp. TY1-4]|uniref:NAD(P)-dependent oxidoreductase n=1 Tax=Photobacterium sp. TY1-4 TaxID=2899122 RepID=UPI0021BE8034|nr:NAD(P)H-binding protein [Photobacterium sp. TY1-4]UXI00779.1 NAD(P)H-binding protein [Photobacterium sp. TY1-4]
MSRICIVGASGKLGQYMIAHALAKGYQIHAVCRAKSVGKLARFKGQISIYPGDTDDRAVIQRAVQGCDAVLTVLVPWGVSQYATRTAQAVLDFAAPQARLIFSCGWHISKDGKDHYTWQLKTFVAIFGFVARLFRIADLADQVRACDTIFNSERRWTVVRGSDLEEGPSQGLPIWREHVGDPALASNLTRRTDFALFMVAAIDNPTLIHQAPAIVGAGERHRG